MHEMICCELPNIPMSSSEIICPVGKFFLGLIYSIFNPTDINENSIIFTCKSEPTLIEIQTSKLGAFLSSVNNKKYIVGNSNVSMFTLPIDISTCVMSCARCSSYLGDAQIKSDEDKPDNLYCKEINCVTYNNNNNNVCDSNTCTQIHEKRYLNANSGHFTTQDIKNVKFQHDKIGATFSSHTIDLPIVYSTEVVYARAMLLLSEIYSIQQFILKPSEVLDSSGLKLFIHFFLKII